MFAKIAPKLVDNGWPSPLPCIGKRPIPVGWNVANVQPVDEATLDIWCAQYPEANVGHAAGNGVVFVDLDVLDPDRAVAVSTIADDIFGPTPALRIGRAPKSLRVYRGSGIRSRKAHPIEIFGDSGQALFYGVHPDTGQPYHWPDDEPLHLAPDDLPEITAEQVERFLTAAAEIVSRSTSTRPRPGVGGVVDLDLFRRLRTEREGKRRRAWRMALAHQLRSAEEGDLHNTLLSVVLAMVNGGFSNRAIRAFVRKHFAAPRTGPYAEVWDQVDAAIRGARNRRRQDDAFEARVLERLGA
jgi:hypothetical protein